MATDSVSIVIPCWNHWELTAKLLLDILQYCSPVDEVIVANNGSDDETVTKSIQWWKSTGKLPLKEFRSEENIGFLGICNLSVPKAKGDIVILISNDVSVRSDLVDKVIRIFEDNKPREKKLVGGILYEGDTGWNKFGNKIFPYLEGWLLAFKKSSWEELGGFDERYAPADYEDVDLSTKAIEEGYKLVPLNEPRIWHEGSKTIGYGPEREKITKKNQKKFEHKWVK